MTASCLPSLPHDLIYGLAEGSGLLWLGAGCSIGSGLPSWENMIKEMARELETNHYYSREELLTELNVFEIAELFRQKLGDHHYYNFLRARFANRNANVGENPTLRAVCDLLNTVWPSPGAVVATTNFDSLIEETMFQSHGKRTRVVIRQQDLFTMSPRHELTLLKPNGDINSADSIVLTQTDYCMFPHRKAQFRAELAKLFSTSTTLFVGYGFRDFTFNMMLSELRHVSNGIARRAYAIVPEVSGAKCEVLKALGIEAIQVPSVKEIPAVIDCLTTAIKHSGGTDDAALDLIDRLAGSWPGLRILLIDDDRQQTGSLAEIFRGCGAHPTVPVDSGAACILAREEEFDLIITDLAMPGCSGWDVIRAVRESELNAHALVVILAGISGNGLPGAFEAGADAVVPKHVPVKQLLGQIFALLRRKDMSGPPSAAAQHSN